VINTDKRGCGYRVNIRRIQSQNEEKTAGVLVRDINGITRSHAAQFAVAALGELQRAVLSACKRDAVQPALSFVKE
jgi:hypothetical protein